MPPLPELPLHALQARFRQALLDGDLSLMADLVVADGMPAEARLAVHRNNLLLSLHAVLADIFPVTRGLLGESLFAAAAYEFIPRHPPAGACLLEYGGGFGDFLAGFEPCRLLPYLPDLARLEWVLGRAMHAPDAEALPLSALASIPPEAVPGLVLTLHPSIFHIESAWPIDRIHRSGRAEEPGLGGVRLEVSREDGEVFLERLDEPGFAFRQALGLGATLEAAAEAALACTPDFDLTSAIAGLFQAGAVVAVTIGLPSGVRE